MRLKYCLLAMLWPALYSCAQTKTDIKPLQIGDTIPPIILTDVVNFPVSQIRLDKFNGKLIILDFWATWCNSCIHSFPKLDSLQKIFSRQLQIILINHQLGTGNSTKEITDFINKQKAKHQLPENIMVVADSTEALRLLFPHTFLPHYIWIGRAGKILGITSSDELTPANIKAVLEGIPVNLPLKNDQL